MQVAEHEDAIGHALLLEVAQLVGCTLEQGVVEDLTALPGLISLGLVGHGLFFAFATLGGLASLGLLGTLRSR